MIRIGRAVVLSRVAGVTIRRSSREPPVHVTQRTRSCRMFSG